MLNELAPTVPRPAGIRPDNRGYWHDLHVIPVSAGKPSAGPGFTGPERARCVPGVWRTCQGGRIGRSPGFATVDAGVVEADTSMSAGRSRTIGWSCPRDQAALSHHRHACRWLCAARPPIQRVPSIQLILGALGRRNEERTVHGGRDHERTKTAPAGHSRGSGCTEDRGVLRHLDRHGLSRGFRSSKFCLAGRL